STKYLGSTFDIHAGGLDLVFPHHENEIAQSEALHDAPMAQYWLHNGFITVNEQKMSKSLGNFFLLREIFQKYAPQVVRFYLLSTHYRSPLDFDDQKLQEAEKGLERLVNAARLLEETLKREAGAKDQLSPETWQAFKEEIARIEEAFSEAMNDDFNTALAIAALFDLARAVNGFNASLGEVAILGPQERAALEEAQTKYHQLAGILGLELHSSKQGGKEASALTDSLIELLIKVRQEARQRKDYQTADLIRDDLKKLGVILEDTPQGVRWRFM
ncbi:MAG TPA: class I tRNA ligase family protein, partial [Peptococcaceae bacterium]|nr:class I tRNA ligase family protein [Peptococcaceae bacterium]